MWCPSFIAHMNLSTNFSSSEAAWCITATVMAAASYLSSGSPSLSSLSASSSESRLPYNFSRPLNSCASEHSFRSVL